jgi:GntR family histidine utilization transcriptional repressor
VKRPGNPKFAVIANFMRRKINAGAWLPGDRAPSESELCALFDVSRMTARRALDQLALDGLIVRRRGAGSFIANNGVRSSYMVIRNIADEIVEIGRSYASRVLDHCAQKAPPAVAYAHDLKAGDEVFHSRIVHLADDVPVQLEYRYVRPDAAPGYITADFVTETPNQYLQRVCPLTDAHQQVTAGLPNALERKALDIRDRQPCLLITRVTSSHVGLVSYARILAPANRYHLSGQLRFSSQLSE